MKNFEKYEDEIREFKDSNFCKDFIRPRILKSDNCAGIHCSECCRRQLLWFLEEYEEPETNWNKIEVDTPILVRDKENDEWKRRYFAKYEHGRVYVWSNGSTSWSACRMYDYKYAKLAEDEKEPEIDWGKVKIDTPILVRQGKNGTWLERHFAKHENGDVYAWVDGQTSWTGADEIKWKYVKLPEDEEIK